MARIQVKVSEKDLDHFFKFLMENPGHFFKVPHLCEKLAQLRMEKIGEKGIKVLQNVTEGVRDFTIDHNKQNLLKHAALLRPHSLLCPLGAIDYISTNSANMRVLMIGPRSEAELFTLYGIGFHPDNVDAIDLISYSPLIDLGDMHDLQFGDNSFDLIVAGWVLAYSSDNQKAADEMLRVARPGAHIAIGCRSEPVFEGLEDRHLSQAGGVPVQSPDERFGTKVVSRFYDVNQILRLFENHEDEDHIEEIYFTHQPHPESEGWSTVKAIFRIK